MRKPLPVIVLIAVLTLSLAGCAGGGNAAVTTATAGHEPGRPPVHYRDRVAVLMYHAFEEPPTSGFMVTKEEFEDHLQTLREAGFHFISADQFRAWKRGHGDLPPNAVLLTMDDGYREVRSVALPLLKKYDVPAIVFVPIRWVDRAPNIMSLDDLRVVQSNGVEVQSHTWNMHRRIRKPDGTTAAVVWTMSQSEMRTDAARSRAVYKGWFGREPDMLAYPYGAFTPELIRAARSEGIRFGFTTQPGLVTRDTPDMSLPRLNAGLRGQSGEDVVQMILQHARAGT